MNDGGSNRILEKYLTKISELYNFDLDTLTYVGGFENYVYSFTKNNQYGLLKSEYRK